MKKNITNAVSSTVTTIENQGGFAALLASLEIDSGRLLREAEEKARREAQEQARLKAEAEEKARREAEEVALRGLKALSKARQEAEDKARLEARALFKTETGLDPVVILDRHEEALSLLKKARGTVTNFRETLHSREQELLGVKERIVAVAARAATGMTLELAKEVAKLKGEYLAFEERLRSSEASMRQLLRELAMAEKAEEEAAGPVYDLHDREVELVRAAFAREGFEEKEDVLRDDLRIARKARHRAEGFKVGKSRGVSLGKALKEAGFGKPAPVPASEEDFAALVAKYSPKRGQKS